MNLRGYPCNPLFAIKIIFFFLKKSFVTFLLPNRILPRETKDAQLSLKSVIDWATLKISQEPFWPYWICEACPAFLHIWDMNSGLGSPSTEIAFVHLQRQPTGLLHHCFCCQLDLLTHWPTFIAHLLSVRVRTRHFTWIVSVSPNCDPMKTGI